MQDDTEMTIVEGHTIRLKLIKQRAYGRRSSTYYNIVCWQCETPRLHQKRLSAPFSPLRLRSQPPQEAVVSIVRKVHVSPAAHCRTRIS
jgi:hypothetical protein